MKTGLMAGGIALLATLGLSFAAFAGTSVDNPAEVGGPDGVFDVLDNCKDLANAPPLDCDNDNDGYGNLCDGDFNQDFATFANDFDIWFVDFTSGGYDGGTGTDMNCDGYVFSGDFDIWFAQFFGPQVPGPSGLHCAGTPPCDL